MKRISSHSIIAVFLALVCSQATAFVQPKGRDNLSLQNHPSRSFGSLSLPGDIATHPSLSRQRQSIAAVQTRGLFGLGTPEILIILIAGAFVIGPEKLGNIAGEFKSGLDDVPDEFKKIPEEFQKGVEEGETNASGEILRATCG